MKNLFTFLPLTRDSSSSERLVFISYLGVDDITCVFRNTDKRYICFTSMWKVEQVTDGPTSRYGF